MSLPSVFIEANKLITDTFKMKKPRSSPGKLCAGKLLDCISPVREEFNKKSNVLAPAKHFPKTQKYEKGEDVLSSGSSLTPQSRYKTPIASPSTPITSNYYLNTSSQEQPEITWDYTTPKRKQGGKKKRRELQITVDELVRNLKQSSQDSTCKSQDSSDALKLYNKWMSLNNSSVALVQKNDRTGRVQTSCRKNSRAQDLNKEMMRLFELMNDTKNSIAEDAQDFIRISSSDEADDQQLELEDCLTTLDEQELACKTNNTKMKKNAIVLDSSIDELWGNVHEDDSVIVKATQMSQELLESCTISAINTASSCPSVIPETLSCEDKVYSSNGLQQNSFSPTTQMTVLQNHQNSNTDNMNEAISNKKGKLFAMSSQPSARSKRDSDHSLKHYDDDWEDDNVADDILSSIPEETLLGLSLETSESSDCNGVKPVSTINALKRDLVSKQSDSKIKHSTNQCNNVCDKSQKKELKISPHSERRTSPRLNKQLCNMMSKQDRNSFVFSQRKASTSKYDIRSSKNKLNDDELVSFNVKNLKQECAYEGSTAFSGTGKNLETVSFEDDAVLMQPDVLSWLNEVETQCSNTQKYTPDEIAQKRKAALKRRQQSQSQKKTKYPHQSLSLRKSRSKIAR